MDYLLDERFWSKVDKTEGCWVWIAGKATTGYGKFILRGKSEYAHRLPWMQLNGPVPDGLELDHLCRVRACVNPSHLEPVTRAVNVQRGQVPANMPKVIEAAAEVKRAMTHCKRGHELTEANTRIVHQRAWTLRSCRACERLRSAARRVAA